MNERIRELAEQAGIELPDDSVYNGHIYRNSLERFARLIVRECLKQIYDRTKIAPGDYNWPDKDVGYNEGINAAYKQVKKHFGVE